MSETATIARAEPGQGNARSGSAPQSSGPAVLPVGLASREPDLAERRVAAQVVDVPVGGASTPSVVGEPRCEASRPAGAPHVCVEPGPDFECPEGADPYTTPGRRLEDEDVGAEPAALWDLSLPRSHRADHPVRSSAEERPTGGRDLLDVSMVGSTAAAHDVELSQPALQLGVLAPELDGVTGVQRYRFVQLGVAHA